MHHGSWPSMDARSGDGPLGLVLGPVRHGGVVLPVVEQGPEVGDLGAEADAAVGVHGADLAEVPAVAAEARDEGRVYVLQAEAEVGDEALLDGVEDGLLVLAREPVPGPVPRGGHGDGAAVGPDVEESRVGEVVDAVRVAEEDVAGDGHVGVRRDVLERVAEPQHVGVGEEEAVAEAEHAALQPELAPDELQVVPGQEGLGGREVDAAGRGVEVAVRVERAAPGHGGGVHGHDEQVAQQGRRAVAHAEALQEQVQQRAGRRPRLVDARDDHRPVVRRRRARHRRREPAELLFVFVFVFVLAMVGRRRKAWIAGCGSGIIAICWW
uniref:Uncharacterized protein n=1 Tax=Zea mays TaxID=4577 RepID=A0A804M7E5_MAIZE